MHEFMRRLPGLERRIGMLERAVGPVPVLVERLEPTADPHRGVHTHDFLQLVYVESGGGAIHVDGEDRAIGAGSLVIAPPGVRHHFDDLDAGVDGWIASVPIALVGVSLSGLHQGRDLVRPSPDHARTTIEIPADSRSSLARRFETLARERIEQRYAYEELLAHELRALLIEVLRSSPPSTSRSQPVSPVTAAVLEIIDREYAGSLSLRSIARRVGRSAPYLTHKVQQEVGRPIMQLIIDRRLQEAARRLTQTDAPLQTIASAVGIDDPQYFARLFRRAFGTSPTRWRRATRAPSKDRPLRSKSRL